MDQSPSRYELHWPRRLFHMISGFVLVALGLILETKESFIIVLAIITFCALAVESLRLVTPRLNHLLLQCFKILVRSGEETKVSGIFYYCLGCLISAIVFPKSIAILAILYLAIGDPVAAIVGVVFGKTKPLKTIDLDSKSLEGSLGCFLVCVLVTFAVTYGFPKPQIQSFEDRLYFSFVGGLAAMLGELLPLRTDDNLSLPVVSGALLWLFAALLNLMPGLYLS